MTLQEWDKLTIDQKIAHYKSKMEDLIMMKDLQSNKGNLNIGNAAIHPKYGHCLIRKIFKSKETNDIMSNIVYIDKEGGWRAHNKMVLFNELSPITEMSKALYE